MGENITAIVPAYNEEKNIIETINAIRNLEFITEIIVIDDGSRDNTYKVLENQKGIILVHHNANKGKGYAIKAALPFVTNKFVILVDADLKQSAIELRKLVSNTKINSKAMLVAIYPKAIRKGGIGLVKGLSKRGLYFLTSKTTNSVLSGQRLISTSFLKSIELPNNFGLEFKITLEAIRNNIEIIEVPVNIRHRETGRDIKGYIHRGKQFVNILNVLIREMI